MEGGREGGGWVREGGSEEGGGLGTLCKLNYCCGHFELQCPRTVYVLWDTNQIVT